MLTFPPSQKVLAELDVFHKYGVYYPDEDQKPIKPNQVTAVPSEDHTTAQSREQVFFFLCVVLVVVWLLVVGSCCVVGC